MALIEDYNIFFADFGIPIILKALSGNLPIDALFFNSEETNFIVGDIDASENNVALVWTSQIGTLTKENMNKCPVEIDGAEYPILDVENDGTGLTRITLEKEPNASRT